MAHRIFEHDKQQGLSQAWHGLTEIVPEITLEKNWLRDFEIAPRPLFYQDGTAAGFSILECTDNPEIKIGNPFNPETFKPISNEDFLGLVRESIAGTPHKIISCGSVRNRGRVFLSLELRGMEQFKAAGREFSAYLNFGNGHDKSSVLWVNTSNVCTVCDNTFSANLFAVEGERQGSQTEDVRIMLRHTKNAQLRFPAIANLIDGAIGVQAEFAKALGELDAMPCQKPTELFVGFLGRNLSEKDVEKGASTRTKNTGNRLVELFQSGRGNRGETMADAFSAVTDYFTHESSRGEDKFKQVLSSEYGAGQAAKEEFLEIARNPEFTSEAIERGERLLAVKA